VRQQEEGQLQYGNTNMVYVQSIPIDKFTGIWKLVHLALYEKIGQILEVAFSV
jgi:hypothetical protein